MYMNRKPVQPPKAKEVVTKTMKPEQPARVYNSSINTSLGPIGLKPFNYTFYDLLVSNEFEDAKLKEQCFEDWAFPIVNTTLKDGIIQTKVSPSRVIRRGFRTNDDGSYRNDTIVAGTKEIVQYIYIILNGMKMPVSSFGNDKGMSVARSNFIICLEVGDPRTGYLGNTTIRYALPLNRSVRDCIQLVNKDVEAESNQMFYYYAIIGDKEIEKEIYDKWFDPNHHIFNGVIYPKVRAFVDWDSIAGVK